MNTRVAFYARVSSEQQSQAGTIESQIGALKARITEDKHIVLKEFEFIDDGYSGSTLSRPELERLRDAAYNYLLDKLYVHAPDRLARKYAYQYLLIEELNRYGIEIIFLTNKPGNDPESELLLQVQGIISEYERTKIMERSRRGKLHAAKQGCHSVLSCAPYGYRYIPKKDNIAYYEIIEEEAKVIRLLFSWIAHERISLNAATKRLTELNIRTPKNTAFWNRGSLHRMLRNTTYKGMAAYGKSKSISRRERLRPHRGQPIVPKISYSTEPTPKEKWIFIPVPAIVDERLFDAVQEQLDENRRLKRQRTTGIRYMLQGLVVCSLCNHAYCGNSTKDHRYYSCVGTRPHGTRKKICNNAYMRADKLENIAWEEIKKLLNNPYYIEKEYNRRIKEIQSNSSNLECEKLNKEKLKIEKSMSRLIDSYAEGIIDKLDFEPRIKSYKKRLSIIGQQILQLTSNQSQQNELRILMERLDKFSLTVRDKLEQKDCQNKREIFEALIKQIEIGKDSVNIVFRVSPFSTSNNIQLEDCRKSANPGYHQSRTSYQ